MISIENNLFVDLSVTKLIIFLTKSQIDSKVISYSLKEMVSDSLVNPSKIWSYLSDRILLVTENSKENRE